MPGKGSKANSFLNVATDMSLRPCAKSTGAQIVSIGALRRPQACGLPPVTTTALSFLQEHISFTCCELYYVHICALWNAGFIIIFMTLCLVAKQPQLSSK